VKERIAPSLRLLEAVSAAALAAFCEIMLLVCAIDRKHGGSPDQPADRLPRWGFGGGPDHPGMLPAAWAPPPRSSSTSRNGHGRTPGTFPDQGANTFGNPSREEPPGWRCPATSGTGACFATSTVDIAPAFICPVEERDPHGRHGRRDASATRSSGRRTRQGGDEDPEKEDLSGSHRPNVDRHKGSVDFHPEGVHDVRIAPSRWR